MRLFFLVLVKGKEPILSNGIKTFKVGINDAIHLAKINDDLPIRKTRIMIDTDFPPKITNEKVHEGHFKLHKGKKFSDPDSYLTLVEPMGESTQIGVMTSKRWPELEYQKVNGNPNGSVAPGLQILNSMDSISFVWERTTYYIHSLGGDAVLSQKKSAPTANVPATHLPFANLPNLLGGNVEQGVELIG